MDSDGDGFVSSSDEPVPERVAGSEELGSADSGSDAPAPRRRVTVTHSERREPRAVETTQRLCINL